MTVAELIDLTSDIMAGLKPVSDLKYVLCLLYQMELADAEAADLNTDEVQRLISDTQVLRELVATHTPPEQSE